MQAEVTGSDTLTYTDPGPLPSGHRYYYLVWGLNADGASRERAEVLVNTRSRMASRRRRARLATWSKTTKPPMDS